MQEFKVISNNLTIGVDWISFTVHQDYSVDEIINLLGFDPQKFRVMPNGANGYKRMRKFENISILYDGSEDMGIHVTVTGSSVFMLLQTYKETLSLDTPFGKAYDLWQQTVLGHFTNMILGIGHFSRIDIAIDDFGNNYYSTDDILRKRINGQIISKWRTSNNNEEHMISDNTKVGHTIYFGSRQSEIFMRVYDKQLEQNKTRSVYDEDYIDYSWTRWELQLGKERADSVAKLLSKNMPLGEVTMNILANYFRIIVLDDSNKSRCSTEEMWLRFVGNVSKLKITVSKEPKTLDEEIKQFEKQQGRKIAKILIAQGGDADYFPDLAERYMAKLTPDDWEQLGFTH